MFVSGRLCARFLTVRSIFVPNEKVDSVPHSEKESAICVGWILGNVGG